MENTLLNIIESDENTQELDPRKTWVLYIDGSVAQQAGLILGDTKGAEFAYALKYDFPVSNNESKYKALLVGLRMTLFLNVKQLIVWGDSKVVFGQVTGSSGTKEDNIKKYLVLAK